MKFGHFERKIEKLKIIFKIFQKTLTFELIFDQISKYNLDILFQHP